MVWRLGLAAWVWRPVSGGLAAQVARAAEAAAATATAEAPTAPPPRAPDVVEPLEATAVVAT